MDAKLLDLLLKQQNKLSYINDFTPLQLKIFNDPSKRKILQLGRQTGKTFLIVALLHWYAHHNPNTIALYLTTEKKHSKALIWGALVELNDKYKLGMRTNSTETTCYLPNGSRIMVEGCKDEGQAEGFRGFQTSLVAVDEAGSFKDYLKYLLVDVLDATLKAYNATVILAGTANAHCSGYYHDCCQCPKEWNIYTGSLRDNPKFPAWRGQSNWRELAEQMLENTRNSEDWRCRPEAFEREYLAKWVRDSDLYILPFDDVINTYDTLPNVPLNYIAGIDFGTSPDPTAFVVCCYSMDDQCLYIEHTDEYLNLSYQQVTTRIMDMQTRYGLAQIVGDPTPGKMIIQDLSNQYGLPIKAAQKRDKVYNLDMLAKEFGAGRIKINSRLKTTINQLKSLQWNEKRNDIREGLADHIADALRYVFTESMHTWGIVKPPKSNDPMELALERERQHELNMINRVRKLNKYRERFGGIR